MKLKIYEVLQDEMLACSKCDLGSEGLLDGHDPHVPGQGNLDAKIMFIAEAPGKEETIHRRPLTPPGKSGRIYEKVLSELGLSRDDVYTTNSVVCRPPKNRDPGLDEVHKCKPFFERQLDLVKPRLIVSFGRFAAQSLLGHIKITKDHGQIKFSEKFGVDVFPLYHPAYIGAYARASHREEFKQDVKRLKGIVSKYMKDGV